MEKLPLKLGKGKGIVGPEFYGCVNTGMQTVLFKAFAGNKAFIVCKRIDLAEARRKNLYGAYQTKRVVQSENNRDIYLFDSYKLAKKKYLSEIEEVIKFNKEEHAKAVKLNALRKQGKQYSEEALKLALELQ